MKITNAYVNVCSPGRNFVTLKIETDEGIYGLGDATLNGRELAVVSYLTEHVIPCILGRDPFQTEDICNICIAACTGGGARSRWPRLPLWMLHFGTSKAKRSIHLSITSLGGKAAKGSSFTRMRMALRPMRRLPMCSGTWRWAI